MHALLPYKLYEFDLFFCEQTVLNEVLKVLNKCVVVTLTFIRIRDCDMSTLIVSA